MRFPDLICLGAQKASTTWLYEVLRQRSDFFLPPVKELHFFAQLYNNDARQYGPIHRADQVEAARKWAAQAPPNVRPSPAQLALADHIAKPDVDDAWYGEIFSSAEPHQICTDVCPSYMNIPENGVDHAMRLNPNAKILVLIRDPVERAWSHIRMHMTRGIETREAEKFVNGDASLWAYLFYTDYAASIPRWQSRTQPDQFKMILHDRVATEPQTVLDEIYDFVGLTVPKDAPPLKGRIHAGEPIDMPLALHAKLFHELQPQYAFLETYFPKTVEQWRDGHLKLVNAA